MTQIIAGTGFAVGGTEGRPEEFDRRLGVIQDLGCGWAELSLCDEDVVANGRPFWPVVRRLQPVAERRGLRYTVHAPLAINLFDTENLAMHEAVTAAHLEVAAAFGARLIVIHCGLAWQQSVAPRTLQRLVLQQRDALRRLGDVAARFGVLIAMETLRPLPGERVTLDAFEMAGAFRDIDHPFVRCTIDVGHSWQMASWKGQDYAAGLRALAPHVAHLHMQDLFGAPKAIRTMSRSELFAFGMDDLHLPLGWGEIPFDEVFRTLTLPAGTTMLMELNSRWRGTEMPGCAAQMVELAAILEGSAGKLAAE